MNELVKRGEISAPIVIGRDHLDTGSVASPFRETEGMLDGSDAIADWALLNALVNTAAGASWISIHNGGGVGIGYSQHAGMVVVADGTDNSKRRLERVLTSDPGMGVIRHADAGYSRAIDFARKHNVRIPMNPEARDFSRCPLSGARSGSIATVPVLPPRRARRLHEQNERVERPCKKSSNACPISPRAGTWMSFGRSPPPLKSVDGVSLLNVDPGASTNRTVVTFAGNPEAAVEAAFRGIQKAAELIDMRKQKGAHPRMGATDVCPFIPVSNVSWEEAIACAKSARRSASARS